MVTIILIFTFFSSGVISHFLFYLDSTGMDPGIIGVLDKRICEAFENQP